VASNSNKRSAAYAVRFDVDITRPHQLAIFFCKAKWFRLALVGGGTNEFRFRRRAPRASFPHVDKPGIDADQLSALISGEVKIHFMRIRQADIVHFFRPRAARASEKQQINKRLLVSHDFYLLLKLLRSV
jgi:hypothetical protein